MTATLIWLLITFSHGDPDVTLTAFWSEADCRSALQGARDGGEKRDMVCTQVPVMPSGVVPRTGG